MEIKNIHPILICFVCLSIMSCSQKNSVESTIAESVNKELISLTPEQLLQLNIKTGSIKKQMISDVIYCGGTIEASPNQQASISVPINGYMKKILVHIGEYVKKGQIIAILEHPDYIDLQRDFLETKSQYNYYKEDFKRQGELSLENATSLKKMQLAQNEFRKIEARFFALKEHLEFIGVNTDSLFVDRIKSSIYLRSPISGYLTKSDGKIGQLCTTEIPVFQVISNTNAVLHLKVFESDAWKVEKGQNIEFSTIHDQLKKFRAVINASTKSVDENNTINLHASIIDVDKNLMPGMYVKAKIIVNADSVFAIDKQAIVKSDDSYFIFIKTDSTEFISRKVNIGRSNETFTEIESLNTDLLKAEIVTSGGYYLQSQMIKNE